MSVSIFGDFKVYEHRRLTCGQCDAAVIELPCVATDRVAVVDAASVSVHEEIFERSIHRLHIKTCEKIKRPARIRKAGHPSLFPEMSRAKEPLGKQRKPNAEFERKAAAMLGNDFWDGLKI